MSVAYGSAGTLITGTTTVSMTTGSFPAGLAADDLLVLVVGMKPSTANTGSVSTPAGWAVSSAPAFGGGYSTTLGADTGNTLFYVFTKTATGSNPAFTVTLNTSNSGWGQMFRFTKTLPLWSVAHAGTGQDTTAGNVSIALPTNPGIAAGDAVLFGMCVPTDAATFSAEAVTAAGVTFGAATEVAEIASATGNDVGGWVAVADVTAGSSTGAPTITATAGGTTTNARGPGTLIRIRDIVPTLMDSVVDDFDDNSLNTTLWSQPSGTTITETNQRLEILPASTGNIATTLTTGYAYTLLGSTYFCKVTPQTKTAATTAIAGLYVTDINNSLNVKADAAAGTLSWTAVANLFTTVFNQSTTYDPVNHAWLRVRESGGTLFLDTSPDGLTWTNVMSQATPAALSGTNSLAVGFYASRNGTTSTNALFDNFNVAPAAGGPPPGAFLPFFT